MILPIYQGGILGAQTVCGKLCIVDTLLMKYASRYIKPISNRYKHTSLYENFKGAMLLQ